MIRASLTPFGDSNAIPNFSLKKILLFILTPSPSMRAADGIEDDNFRLHTKANRETMTTVLLLLASAMRSARVVRVVNGCGGGAGGAGGALLGVARRRGGVFVVPSSARRGSDDAHYRGITITATSRTTATKMATPRDDADCNDDVHLQFETLHELVWNATSRYGPNALFGTFTSSSSSDSSDSTRTAKRIEWTTYAQFGRDIALARYVLRHQLGVLPYSKVGIISNNRREWAIVASAAYSLNAAVVPMYENQRPDDWAHILNDSGCTSLFCSTADVYSKARMEALSYVPSIPPDDVICLDAPEHEPHSFLGAMARAERDLLLLGGGGGVTRRTTTATTMTTATTNDIPEDFGIVAPSPDDLANLIYTSGTTGKPKGVELVHSNQVSNIKGCRDMGIDISDFPASNDRSLAFLPWAHSYGQASMKHHAGERLYCIALCFPLSVLLGPGL